MSKGLLRLIVLVVLGGASFGVAFMVGKMMSKSPEPTQAQGDPTSRPAELAELPAGKEPQPSSDTEARLDELARELKTRIESLAQRERALEVRSQRIQAADEALKNSASELQSLQGGLLESLRKIKDAQAKLDSSRIVVAQSEKGNLKRIALTYEKMDSLAAGKTLEALCETKLEDDAVRILSAMSERSAANLLAEIADKRLVARLTEKMKRLKEET